MVKRCKRCLVVINEAVMFDGDELMRKDGVYGEVGVGGVYLFDREPEKYFILKNLT